MHRDKFPEKIPFRLTRMLINAMEVSGIEGNYRITCENVMRVLRENKESLMAVLEAFVHDPLINWRLLNNNEMPSKETKQKKVEDTLTDSALRNPTIKRMQKNENTLIEGKAFFKLENEDVDKPEALNPRALTVINRVSNKLTGRDFKSTNQLDVPLQVQRLILQATSIENLCQCYIGWCAFW